MFTTKQSKQTRKRKRDKQSKQGKQGRLTKRQILKICWHPLNSWEISQLLLEPDAHAFTQGYLEANIKSRFADGTLGAYINKRKVANLDLMCFHQLIENNTYPLLHAQAKMYARRGPECSTELIWLKVRMDMLWEFFGRDVTTIISTYLGNKCLLE